MTSLSSRSIRAARLPLSRSGLQRRRERQGTVAQGSFKDAARIRELAAICDVLTVEIEHVNCDVLDELVAEGKPGDRHRGVIRIIQDKFMQKQHFCEARRRSWAIHGCSRRSKLGGHRRGAGLPVHAQGAERSIRRQGECCR